MKNRFKVKYGTWNVRTLIGRYRALSEVLRRRNVNVCCVKELKWKEEKVKEIGEGHKILYSGKSNSMNGVGIILDKDMKGKVVEVFRISDRVIIVKVMMEEKVWNIVSVYASTNSI